MTAKKTLRSSGNNIVKLKSGDKVKKVCLAQTPQFNELKEPLEFYRKDRRAVGYYLRNKNEKLFKKLFAE